MATHTQVMMMILFTQLQFPRTLGWLASWPRTTLSQGCPAQDRPSSPETPLHDVLPELPILSHDAMRILVLYELWTLSVLWHVRPVVASRQARHRTSRRLTPRHQAKSLNGTVCCGWRSWTALCSSWARGPEGTGEETTCFPLLKNRRGDHRHRGVGFAA